MTSHDEDIDLLTAAIIGLTVGVGAAMLFRRRPAPRTALSRGMEMAGRGARMASMAGASGARMASNAAEDARRGYKRGRDWADDVSLEAVGEQLHEYFDAAKEAIEDTVSGELQDLRKSIRRRRRRLGI